MATLTTKVFLYKNAVFYEVLNTELKGHIRIKPNRGDLEVSLLTLKIICDLSLKMGNILKKRPPILEVETNITIIQKYLDNPLGLFNLEPRNGNPRTNEVAVALAYSTLLKANVHVNSEMIINDYNHYPEYDEQQLYMKENFKHKFSINNQHEFCGSHGFSTHSICQFILRYKNFNPNLDPMLQMLNILTKNNLYLIKNNGKAFHFLEKKSETIFIFLKINTNKNINRLMLLTFKHQFDDPDFFSKCLDKSVDKKESLIAEIDVIKDNIY